MLKPPIGLHRMRDGFVGNSHLPLVVPFHMSCHENEPARPIIIVERSAQPQRCDSYMLPRLTLTVRQPWAWAIIAGYHYLALM
jgi:hypothetical protein